MQIKIFTSLEHLISIYFDGSAKITNTKGLSGGDIGKTTLVELSDNKSKNNHYLVIKNYHGNHAHKLCTAEYIGLSLIAETNTIQVPKVYGIIHTDAITNAPSSTTSLSQTALVLSYHKNNMPHTDASRKNFWQLFAKQLTAMHMAPQLDITMATEPAMHTKPTVQTKPATHTESQKKYFGLEKLEDHANNSNNFIGLTPQINTTSHSWITFFSTQRIWYQCTLAYHNKYFNSQQLKHAELFCTKLNTLLIEPYYASLLHGDLWAGNFLCYNNKPVLIDPSVYYGHYEADIAMTELFGGFDNIFYESYAEILPLTHDYHQRKHIYNLYHLLNHLNLFGGSYLHRVLHIIDRFL